ncbi:uncharacterized protein C3orf22 homolog [Marmota flaviventris]|uniref:uncharacterized protein C3orf22 homolog n=1 Tax=Marmota flaviventris TaxID=93162 RepID=UPI003A873D5E
MEPRTHKKCPQHKKPKSKAQDRFTNNFPYRFSWLTEPTTESLKVWDSRNTPPRDLLPLQKKLVATRSIPVPGHLRTPTGCVPGVTCGCGWLPRLRAPQHTASPSIYPPPPPPPPPPQCHLWELKLLSLRFPKQAGYPPFPLHSDTKDPWLREANQPSRGFS